ncbi:MAG: endolytic transglycosylase MltG [Flavobacteriales bacterium]|nr:MAG: endolytic transglycosylase MltG [Flavobacteriales bacterium]
MNKKKKIIIGISIMLIASLVLLIPEIYSKVNLYFASQESTINKEEKSFYIQKRTNLNDLATQLKKENIIDDETAFIQIGEYKGMDENKIALGKYIIAPNTKIKDLLNGFKINSKGNGNAEVEVTVTFNNCKGMYQLNQLSQKVAESIIVDSTTIAAYLNEPSTYNKYGFTKEQFPSMFISDSYQMFYDTDEKQFVDRMAKEFRNFWSSGRLGKLNKINLKSPSALYTLASMVYMEQSRLEEEWSDIAKLYLNRMEINMLLQSDPTFVFCWGDKLKGVTRLLYEHRDIECAYNTYKIKGLPPGPICLVNRRVLEASLNPSEVNYLYMYGDGVRHYFSRNYGTHLRNTRR